MTIKRPLILMTGGFVLGEVLALFHMTVEMAVLVFAAGGLWFCLKRGRSLILVILPLFIVLGFMRMELQLGATQQQQGLNLDGSYVTMEGLIREIGRKKDSYVITTDANQIQKKDGVVLLPKLLIYLNQENGPVAELKIGMKISVSGEINLFPQPRNPGEFDSAAYYRSLKLDYRMFGDSLTIKDTRSDPYRETLRQISLASQSSLHKIAQEQDLGIFQAAILGDKSSLDSGVKDLYQKNGIAHLLAISGLHVSIAGMGIYRFLRKIGLGYALSGFICGCMIVSYGILTGSSSSVIRAVIMLLCTCLANYLGRTYDLVSAACLAGLLLFFDSPYLLFQGGVQLSFGAVLSIGLLGSYLIRCFHLNSGWQKTLAVSLSIQIVTYPIVLYHFYQYPVYGIFLNFLVIPLMTYVIGSGILGILLGSFSISAGIVAIGSGHYILVLYQWLCVIVSKLPYDNLILGRPPIWKIGIYYLLLLTACFLAAKCGDRKRRLLVMTAVSAFCFILLFPQKPKGLEVTFLDVGQGDGIILQTDRYNLLVDGGSTSVKEVGQYRMEPFLKSRGISVIDYALVSHGDQDHISGLLYLLNEDRGIFIRHLILPCLGNEDEAYEPLKQAVRAQGGDVSEIAAGDRLLLGDLIIQCIYPGKNDRAEDRNEQSEVLLVNYGEFCMLLTGDTSEDAEIRMLEGLDPAVDLSAIQVLKVAHHGSKTSTGQRLLDAVSPAWAVLSYEQGNSYGHPHKETVDRLEGMGVRLWHTAVSGGISLKTDGSRLWWSAYLPESE